MGWRGDVDPGFSRKQLEPPVDFTREILGAVGLGEVLLGTVVSIDSIYLFTGGIMRHVTAYVAPKTCLDRLQFPDNQ